MIEEFEMKKSRCGFLRHSDVRGFFHANYYPVRSSHPDAPRLRFLNDLKNDDNRRTDGGLRKAVKELEGVLLTDFLQIRQILKHMKPVTVCVVPRAEKDECYKANQLLFRKVVGERARLMCGFEDGSRFITRHTDTKTTHRKKLTDGSEKDGLKSLHDGKGIARDTCHFAPQIRNEELDILLVDDIYTRNVNIDEDMAQALFDEGARSVVFYAVGRTVKRR